MNSFLGIDWGTFVVVFLTALAATTLIVFSFALGIRLLADGRLEDAAEAGVARQATGRPGAATSGRSPARTLGGWLCLAVAGAAVLYGLWMAVPQFH